MKRKYKKYAIAGAAALIILLFFVLYGRGGSSSVIQSAKVSVGNVVETVSVTGHVLPVGKADLSFEKSGVVGAINVKVGDHVKKGTVLASLDSSLDRASLASAQAKLADMTRSLRPEEFAADEAKVTSAQVALNNAEQDAINASRQAYVQVQGAINNYADVFFTNPQTINPTITIQTPSQAFQTSINSERITVSGTLSSWKADIDTASSSDLLVRASSYMNSVKVFMSDLSAVVNSLSPGSSGLSQQAINAYLASVNSAMTGLNNAIATVTAAKTGLANASSNLDSAKSQFTLDKARSSPESVAAQSAQVALAQASFDQDSIVSPIDGIVSKASPNIGEFVPAGQAEFGVINDSIYKIESYVPEADIAKVSISNSAAVTLDAYGPNINFPAKVTNIDPAQTTLEGVPTYKVTLYFDESDSRILSGMTANTEILTHEADNVLYVPYRSVVSGNGSSIVRVLRSDGKNFDGVTVKTGLRGSDGTIEILSGLVLGQSVIVDLKQ